VLKPVTVATEWNTFLNFFLDALPSVSMINHFRYVEIFVANVVELKDAMIG
jgi:hypothetical protein